MKIPGTPPPPGTRYLPRPGTPQTSYPPWDHPPDQVVHPPGPGNPPRGAVHAGRYGQQAGGTHPTGMHSCYLLFHDVLGICVTWRWPNAFLLFQLTREDQQRDDNWRRYTLSRWAECSTLKSPYDGDIRLMLLPGKWSETLKMGHNPR